ncbi:MAG: DUF503 domain-containing protein [Chloroflexota bacterium]|nr:DUF503 domain-containing protein [Chloroflexota bacterium]
MHIGACRLTLYLPDSRSLKDRRQVARSLTARISNKFNVAVAEEADSELRQRLTLLVCAVSSEADHANEMLSQVVDFVEEVRPDVAVLASQVEMISGV